MASRNCSLVVWANNTWEICPLWCRRLSSATVGSTSVSNSCCIWPSFIFQSRKKTLSSLADWQLHVLLDSCWVSRWSNPFRSDPDQIDLVHNGCLRSPNLDWFKPDKYFKQVQYSPSGLVINRILSHGSYLHCQLSTCHEETGSAEQKVTWINKSVFLL